MIRKLAAMQVGQYIRDDGPKSHHDKAGTPTMGGTLIIISITVSILLWSDLTNYFVWIVLFVIIGYGLVGFVDDYLMQIKKQSKGLTVRSKLALQVVIALVTGFLVYVSPDFSTQITIPFFKNISPDFGWAYIIFAAFVIVGASNAVNLTDGLDGLAIGPVIIAATTYMIFAYVAGHVKIANYLPLTRLKSLWEMSAPYLLERLWEPSPSLRNRKFCWHWSADCLSSKPCRSFSRLVFSR
jgi:phospho-N-acetylmuramoyl-pentapeptide-transferase